VQLQQNGSHEQMLTQWNLFITEAATCIKGVVDDATVHAQKRDICTHTHTEYYYADVDINQDCMMMTVLV